MRSEESQRPRVSSGLILTNEGLVWVAATVLLGAVGWFKSLNLVLILAYMMAALVCLNGWLAKRQVRRVRVAADERVPVFAGERTTSRVTVTNVGPTPATVRVEDRGGEGSTSWFIHRLVPGATVACTGACVFRHRGRFASMLEASSLFPLGLVRFHRLMADECDVVVLPAPGVADADGLRRWLLRQTGGDGRARRVLRRVTTDQADVRGVRPYRPGDPIRGIHWRSTARRGELMVREYDIAPSPELVLVVEPWLPDHPTETERSQLESALSLAVTIARSWSRAFATRVTIAVAGEAGSVRTAAPYDAALRHALSPLADLEGRRVFETLGPSCFDRSLQRAACLVVSSRRNSPYAAALTRATRRLFLAIAPSSRPAWYEPPVTVVKPH